MTTFILTLLLPLKSTLPDQLSTPYPNPAGGPPYPSPKHSYVLPDSKFWKLPKKNFSLDDHESWLLVDSPGRDCRIFQKIDRSQRRNHRRQSRLQRLHARFGKLARFYDFVVKPQFLHIQWLKATLLYPGLNCIVLRTTYTRVHPKVDVIDPRSPIKKFYL